MKKLLILALLLGVIYMMSGNVVEGLTSSPGTFVQLRPLHDKRYGTQHRADHEDYGAARLGPMTPPHFLDAHSLHAKDPCFEKFEDPYVLQSIESQPQPMYNNDRDLCDGCSNVPRN